MLVLILFFLFLPCFSFSLLFCYLLSFCSLFSLVCVLDFVVAGDIGCQTRARRLTVVVVAIGEDCGG
ncbi:hypothetical protein ES332_A09G200000v1 [Gossypium tomentosum]|uniref:Uncharacterized protein n=1 Tax=Gossypium tomentosum TaxID=34277 RepID=A0A5D2P785_GOSTO|nr:hypothetical protein ES332_A09G200000v1 [Gossypium tomentosum]